MEYIYLHCSVEDFNKHSEKETAQCIMIEGEFTLRGRVPGRIVVLESGRDKWNDQEIMESIDRYKNEWGQKDDREDKGKFEYGV